MWLVESVMNLIKVAAFLGGGISKGNLEPLGIVDFRMVMSSVAKIFWLVLGKYKFIKGQVIGEL